MICIRFHEPYRDAGCNYRAPMTVSDLRGSYYLRFDDIEHRWRKAMDLMRRARR